jgi:tetratricopeptide (TPR) repeat protein
MGKYELAIASYDLALQIKPDYASVFYNRGLANFEMWRLDLALLDLERAIIFDSDNIEFAAFKLKIIKKMGI